MHAARSAPSTSVSLASTAAGNDHRVPSLPLAVSSAATGASFTALTVTLTVAGRSLRPVGNRVGEAVGAVEIGFGRVREGPVAVVCDRAMRGLGEGGNAGGVACCQVGVVRQHVAGDDRGILVSARRTSIRATGLLEGAMVTFTVAVDVERAVRDRVGEAVGAAVAGDRRIR